MTVCISLHCKEHIYPNVTVTTVCLRSLEWQRQTAVTAHFSSKQLLLFAFARRTMCLEDHIATWLTPMAHSYRLGLVTWGYQVRISVGTDICHRGCAYTVLQTVQSVQCIVPMVLCTIKNP